MSGYPTHLPDTRPASNARAVTKGTALLGTARALWIGTAGTLNFTTADGSVITNFPAKEGLLPVATASVQASGTADDIWALY
jgi:hypothetical protein